MMFPFEPSQCVTIGNMEFNDWILLQLQERDWSQAELARLSGLTRSAVSKYLTGRIPDKDALRKISKALNLSPELVFEKAGLLPPKPELSSAKRAAIHAVETADDDDAEFIYKWLTERKEHKKLTFQPRPQK